MSKKRSVANSNFHIPSRNDRLTETSLCNRREITRSIEKRYRRKKPGQRVKSAEHFRERGGVVNVMSFDCAPIDTISAPPLNRRLVPVIVESVKSFVPHVSRFVRLFDWVMLRVKEIERINFNSLLMIWKEREKIGKSRRISFAIEKRFENKLNVCVRGFERMKERKG